MNSNSWVRAIPHYILACIRKISSLWLYWAWKRNGRPVPPPHLAKQHVIGEFREKYEVENLVETGTYEGDTVQSQLNKFKKIISIEVSEELYRTALEKFEGCAHVTLFNGDSGQILKDIVPQLDSRSLFWLDGHYSGGVTGRGILDTPIKEELNAIFRSEMSHIILIDDARCFTGENGYPSLSELKKWVTDGNKYSLSVEDDVIRLTPISKPSYQLYE